MAERKLLEMLKRSVEEFNNRRKHDLHNLIVDLSHADLDGTNLEGADLHGMNLSHASLKNAVLSHANLKGANLESADLGHAKLDMAHLSEARFDGADVQYADFTSAFMDKVAVRDMKGLESACFAKACLESRAQAIILACIAESFKGPAGN